MTEIKWMQSIGS